MRSRTIPENKNVLIIGAGVAGIEVALNLAEIGIKVYLVEKEPTIGGKMALMSEVFHTNGCSMCVLAPKVSDVKDDPNIILYTNSEITGIIEHEGNYTVTSKIKPRYIDKKKCKGCIDICTHN